MNSQNYNKHNKYSLSDFLYIVRLLRSPRGCQWDRAKTHSSIRANLIEEAYEAVEAIDLGDSDMLKEELGDILLQIAFHCSIEESEDNFSFDDVVDEICKKIITRHPHVFAGMSDLEENHRIGSSICREARTTSSSGRRNIFKVNSRPENPADRVKNVSKILPALMRTVKVQERAAKEGYGLFAVEDAISESFEKLHYLETLILEDRKGNYDKELGDLLFAVTEVSRLMDVDPESSLYDSCERFKNEFLYKISLENRNKV